jgi:hypothetical protein
MTRYAQSLGVVLRVVAGEHLLIPTASAVEHVFALNRVGLWVWEHVAQPATLDELVAGLTAEFDVTESKAMSDVTAFLAGLSAKGLVFDESQ